VSAKQRCIYCNEPLPFDKRSDALYCSDRCSKRGRRALKRPAKELKRRDWLDPPLEAYNSETDVYRVTYESPIRCSSCGHFSKTSVVMSVHGSTRFWRACGIECLRELVDR
jgi:hypothetical protein